MSFNEDKRYVGMHNDFCDGMTHTGKVIRDAQAFGLIPEDETCEGWLMVGIEDLWRKVDDEWEKYGFLVGNLPEDVRERFLRIHAEAVKRAKAAGWDGEVELQDDK